MACIIIAGVTFENTDQRSAIAPVTNGTAKLVPVIRAYTPLGDVLVMFTPGAISARLPIDRPKFDIGSSLPCSSQAAAVTSNSRFVRIVAGAGAGKTEVLTQRIAYLLLVKGVEPSSIVAFTFTKKAAKSMKSGESMNGLVS
jgi:hypothetical protein